MPIGVIGELYIGGIGVALGYHHQAELTAQRFIVNKFSSDPNARLYKTGDRVRWREDGNLEYIGRRDNQVKMHGYRIGLGEIEAALLKHSNILQCAVVLDKLAINDQRLIAYLVFIDKTVSRSYASIRQLLSESLPDYMIPSIFIQLDQLPLTASGKIDKAALSQQQGRKLTFDDNALVAARTQEEKKLVELWQKILHVDQVGIFDNFFELGGHSLLAVRLASRIQEIFQIECSVKIIFEHPIITQLALYVQEQSGRLGMHCHPINSVDRTKCLPLSCSEQRLWFLEQCGEIGVAAYNIPIAIRLLGDLSVTKLRKCFDFLIARHENLRTVFKSQLGKAYQEIMPLRSSNIEVEVINKSHLDEIMTEESHRPFDLEVGPLLRLRLFKLGKRDHVLMINQHHIISDGKSVAILLKELSALYGSDESQWEENFPPLKIQYADFAVWQKQSLAAGHLQAQRDYWCCKLANFTRLNLPTTYCRPEFKTYNGRHHYFYLDRDLFASIKEVQRTTHATLFMILLSAFAILLSRYSGQDDIVIGSPVANRSHNDIAGIIGFFVNMLALRVDLSDSPNFMTVLKRVKQTCLEAYIHQDMPFEHLIDVLQVERDTSSTPIFQVVFLLRNANDEIAVSLPNIEEEVLTSRYNRVQYDMTFNVAEMEFGLGCDIEYNIDLFGVEMMAAFARHFEILLKGLINNLKQPVHSLPLLTTVEKQTILTDWNKTETPLPTDITLHSLFAQQVASAPDNQALCFEKKSLTYRELNKAANQLAQLLLSRYAGATNRLLSEHTLIGICMTRSVEMVIAVLGILKAGAAYVPLDPESPVGYLSYKIKDAQIKVLLTQNGVLKKLPFLKKAKELDAICLDGYQYRDSINRTVKNLPATGQATDLACVIYTAGQTRKSKGVMLTQRNILNLLLDIKTKHGTSAKDKLLSVSPIRCEVFILELLLPLLSGATLMLCSKQVLGNPTRLAEIITAWQPTIMQATPAIWASVVDRIKQKIPHLTIFSVGKGLPQNLAAKLKKISQHVWSLYGTPETTICSAYSIVKDDPRICIGKGFANTKFYVLDAHLNPVPIGIPGLLYISGAGVASGYWRQPERSKEKFIDNIFNTDQQQKYQYLFNTGDCVYWTQEGNLVAANTPIANHVCVQKPQKKPRSELETIIATTISSLLKTTDIDVQKNFFDLGLHSLLLVEACSLLNNILGDCLKIMYFFSYPNVRALAEFLSSGHHCSFNDKVESKHRFYYSNASAVIPVEVGVSE